MIHNWNYPEGFNIEDYYGFVYKITNTENNKFYIGKKIFKNTRKIPPLKGYKRKRTVIKESNWKTYWGSSKPLLEDVKSIGEGKFDKTILRLCETKKQATYWEMHYQIIYEVLNKPETTYNDNILGKFFPKDLEN
jgi:hypothetical protein|tara:strand:+ start:1504 stop:1908 length:405 start_codon:yes stop_codon:yes gene_type:complete